MCGYLNVMVPYCCRTPFAVPPLLLTAPSCSTVSPPSVLFLLVPLFRAWVGTPVFHMGTYRILISTSAPHQVMGAMMTSFAEGLALADKVRWEGGG